MLANLNDQRGKLQSMLESLSANPTDPQLADMAVQLLLSGTEAQLSLGEFQISSGRTQLEAGQTQLDSAREEYESAREEALKSANLDQLLNMNTLKQLIAAQNFSMPAGYIDGGEGDDNQYILKVGDAFDNVDELKSMVLCSIDGIGDVRLSDVADMELTDNADDSYAKVGKNRAVLLSIYKSSTASTSSVSNASTAAMKELMAENDGLHLTTIMDQGDYIKLIVNSVMSNLIEGAVLAIIVLALFLKDIRPTLVVAISMPLSVLFAIVMMYFSGITLNILSLSGLGLGVGMLVDNSVVVIENIYRLRARHSGPACCGAGRTPGGGGHRVLHPDHGLRVPAHGVYHRHGAGAAFRYGMDHHVQPAGIPRCGPYRGALRRFHRTAQAKRDQAPLVRPFPERVRKAFALLLKAQGHPAHTGDRAAGRIGLAHCHHGRDAHPGYGLQPAFDYGNGACGYRKRRCLCHRRRRDGRHYQH